MERELFNSLEMEFSAVADEFKHTHDFEKKHMLIEKAKKLANDASQIAMRSRQRAHNAVAASESRKFPSVACY